MEIKLKRGSSRDAKYGEKQKKTTTITDKWNTSVNH